jgi:cysteine desulfurase
MPVNSVYLDHAATTPVRPEVRDAMAPYLDDRFGNPSSTHRWGRQARNALEEARERVAAALGAKRREIVFTSGGTEADNLAVLGRWRSACRAGNAVPRGGAAATRAVAGADEVAATHGATHSAARGAAIVISAVEHKAVAAAARCAVDEGAELVVLGVDEAGVVQLPALDEALRARPCVVSVMWANNEVGTIQPVAEIGARCRAAGVVFHTDAVQAFGKVPVRVDETPCDLLAISAHKVGGPKGIGALYIREATAVLPLVHGGGQERDLRPGTENVAAAVGLAVAAELAVAGLEEHAARTAALRDRLETGLRQALGNVVVNGPADRALRLPNILNITLPAADQEALLIGLDLEGVAVSGASACLSGAVQSSHVLRAMGRAATGGSVRLSLGWTTTQAEVDFGVAAFARIASGPGTSF